MANQEGIAAPFLTLISLKTDERSFIRVFFVALDVAAALLEVPAPKLAEALTVRYNAIKGEGMISMPSFPHLISLLLPRAVFRVPLKPEEVSAKCLIPSISQSYQFKLTIFVVC